MKKTIVIVLAALIALSSLFAQGANEAASSTTKIVVGATPEPHAALLSLVVLLIYIPKLIKSKTQ